MGRVIRLNINDWFFTLGIPGARAGIEGIGRSSVSDTVPPHPLCWLWPPRPLPLSLVDGGAADLSLLVL